MAAAAANAAKVATKSKQHAATLQPLGADLVGASNRLLGLPLPGGQMLLWILILGGLFGALPFALAVAGRRRRKPDAPEEMPA